MVRMGDDHETLVTIIATRGFSIEAAAQAAGLGRKSVSRWVNGHHQPQPAKVAALARVLCGEEAEIGPMILRIQAACRRAVASRESAHAALRGAG